MVKKIYKKLIKIIKYCYIVLKKNNFYEINIYFKLKKKIKYFYKILILKLYSKLFIFLFFPY
jgi:hypothetical protein